MFFGQGARFSEPKVSKVGYVAPRSSMSKVGAKISNPSDASKNKDRMDFTQVVTSKGLLVKGSGAVKPSKGRLEYSPNYNALKPQSARVAKSQSERFTPIPGTEVGKDSPGPGSHITDVRRHKSCSRGSFGTAPRTMSGHLSSSESIVYRSRSDSWCSSSLMSQEAAAKSLKSLKKSSPRAVMLGRSELKRPSTPGPGQYNVERSSLQGKALAMRPATPCTRISDPGPGPGDYYQTTNLVRKTFNRKLSTAGPPTILHTTSSIHSDIHPTNKQPISRPQSAKSRETDSISPQKVINRNQRPKSASARATDNSLNENHTRLSENLLDQSVQSIASSVGNPFTDLLDTSILST
mmetsp:Transcript_5421/g.5576  ORF Transcript_5421/g.5576 Transcript_5421/m.5576 type:complete len:351 (+) Transcript_5421:231-1283(+)